MKITNAKEARTWLHEILKPHLTEAVSDKKLHEAVILSDGAILLTTDKGQYLNIQVNIGQDETH